MDLKTRIVDELTAVRSRSLDLLDPLDPDALVRQHSPLMSPLIWDLAHVGNYEDLWLLRARRRRRRRAPVRRHLRRLPPRPARSAGPGAPRPRRHPPLPRGGATSRAVDRLDAVDLDGAEPLLRDGFVYGMVVQHEHQHDETMLATLNLMAAPGYQPALVPPPAARSAVPDEVLVAAGPFVMGTSDEPWAYDNERPAHVVELPAFWIDAAPVTNGQYAAFVAAGGYDNASWWAPAGWAWRQEAGLEHPQFWQRDGSGWHHTRFGWREALPAAEPVQHVCWYEADAYARWAGKRLPTEAEWEKAAAWDPVAGRHRRYPWGDGPPTADHANLDQRHFGPAPVGAYPAGASAYGCVQLLGDVWEWTASDFRPLPGVRVVPVPRVLRSVLRRRVQGAAGRLVGHPSQRRPHDVPQLGLPHPPPDLRRVPVRPRPRRRARMTERATLTIDVHLDAEDLDAALRADVTRGLTSAPKWLPPKWFYDDARLGSCSTPSPACPSTTRRDASARSSPARRPRSPGWPGPTRSSSWARARRRRRACCSMPGRHRAGSGGSCRST